MITQDDHFVKLVVSKPVALILFELCSRLSKAEWNDPRLQLEDKAEAEALSFLLAELEKILVEPFSAEYSDLLAQAKSRLTYRDQN